MVVNYSLLWNYDSAQLELLNWAESDLDRVVQFIPDDYRVIFQFYLSQGTGPREALRETLEEYKLDQGNPNGEED